MTNNRFIHRQFAARQRGVVLAVALILLAVIGLGSVAALKSGLFGGLVANNLRSNELAVQAAEMALTFCERQAVADPPGVPIQPLPPVATDAPVLWATITPWTDGTAFNLPDPVVNSPRSDVRYVQAPQCLVERMELIPLKGSFDEVAFLITARGFSPDYRVDGNGQVVGSEVWLQSTMRYTP
ncbi:MAG: pilus assembly PilX family protein [Burkholderiaceae bacterium]